MINIKENISKRLEITSITFLFHPDKIILQITENHKRNKKRFNDSGKIGKKYIF